jgi:hypothetical protein
MIPVWVGAGGVTEAVVVVPTTLELLLLEEMRLVRLLLLELDSVSQAPS